MCLRPFLTLLSICSTCFAQLEWKERSQEFWAAPGDTNVVAHYTFTNSGTKAITIAAVATSCDCTTASMNKKIYRPGEKGEVTAIFTVANRTGVHDKTITVKSNDPKGPTALFKLRITIGDLIKIKPATIEWRTDEPKAPKTVMLDVAYNLPIHVLSVKSDSPMFMPKLQTLLDGQA